MKLKERVRQFIRHNSIILFFRLLADAVLEAYSQSRHLGASRMMHDEVKFAADLCIRTHAIEKGMSIGSVRVGFGQPKVLSLIDDLLIYVSRFPSAQIDESMAVIERYIAFNCHNGCNVEQVASRYEQLKKAYAMRENIEAGIATCNRAETLQAANASFDLFSQSRYSIRDFDPQGVIDENDIIAAIDIARKAPSACNRQPACAHIYKGKKAHELFDFQGGCNGFGQDMSYAILVTADMRRYFINERHQMYVDGGLFAMELLLSLHYKGVATIPLTTAYKTMRTRLLKKRFGIAANEVPIMIIGVGAYKESYKVAVSHRNPVASYYKMHD